MGKLKIIKKENNAEGEVVAEKATKSSGKGSKTLKIASGVLRVQATYNNTLISLADHQGNMVMWATSGSSGFKGAKKGTPFAASKVASLLADKAKAAGLLEADIILKGVGAGRESAIRAFASKGIKINLIRDITPVPHNGPKPKKSRRI